MQQIIPFLSFRDNAEEAVNFYATVFPDFHIGGMMRMPNGVVVTAPFRLNGMDFVALNMGPTAPPFSMATSFAVNCNTQAEIDHLWDKLSDGGTVMQCGWLSDKYGVTWQIVPTVLPQLLGDPDPAKAQRAMQAMMQMVKFDIATLEKAHAGLV